MSYIQKFQVTRVRCCKKLIIKHCVLLLPDNNFNSFKFACSIDTIFVSIITHFKHNSFHFSTCMCRLSSESMK